MNKQANIKVADLIGSHFGIDAECGQKIFDKVKLLLEQGYSVTLDFDQITILISVFLNVAIGQLYGSFTEEEICEKVHIKGLSEDNLELVECVIENAKKYYKNPEGYDAIWAKEEGN